MSLGHDCPCKRNKQQYEPCQLNRRAFKPTNGHDVAVGTWNEGIYDDDRNDQCKQCLENSTDKIVCTVRTFENNWIYSCFLPDHVRAPKERRGDVSKEIDWKKIFR